MSSNLITYLGKMKENLATESNTLPADHTGPLYHPHRTLQALVPAGLQQVQVQVQMQLQLQLRVQPQY